MKTYTINGRAYTGAQLAEVTGLPAPAAVMRYKRRFAHLKRPLTLADMHAPLRPIGKKGHRGISLPATGYRVGAREYTMAELAEHAGISITAARARYAKRREQYPGGFTMKQFLALSPRGGSSRGYARAQNRQRNKAIIRRSHKESYKAIGADYGISRQAVYQIVQRGY